MTRDTFKAQCGGANRFKGCRVRPARRTRFIVRLRLTAAVLCCALALQPTLIAPARGKVRAASGGARGARSESPLTLAGRSLLAAAAAVGEVLRPLVPARAADSAAAPGGASEPAPAAVVFLGAPTGLAVVSTTDSQVNLSWTPAGGAAGYRVERSPNVLTPFSTVAQPTANSYPDGGLTRGATFLYRVRAVDSEGALSPPSAVVMATAITYADDPIVRNVTIVKADHVNDLRLAVAGVRRAAGLPAAAWEESVLSGVPVRAAHVNELRAELDEARAALGLPTPAYTDPTLSTGPGGTRIRKEHFDDLRARARSGAGVTGSGISAYDFASARLDSSNRTGGGGIDPLSRNFNWSLPVVSLPGRSGLDLGLALTYNSLVWTKSGNYVLFDGDWGWPAPGFRLGFPVVQGKFYDTQAQKDAYMLVTPSGARVSLRRTATPTLYEAGDSSYLQLTENADGSLTLVAPGGARMSYSFLGGAYKCTEVKDRNGNYITAAYNGYGNLETVTDTLGRVLTFGYHPDGYLKEITQVWHREVESGGTVQTVTETHRWAKFEYDDPAVATNFGELTVFGPTTGQTIHALKRVTLADGSSFTFDYTSWGQVNKVASYAPNNGLLNQISLDLPADATTPRDDCPRPTQRRDWAAYWNGDEDGAVAAAEEAVTSYAVSAGATWQNPETNAQETGTLAQVTPPDPAGVVYKEYSHASGWDKGLPRLSEVWSASRREKWTSIAWTQDDESLIHGQNPRVRETNVYDPKPDGSVQNRRRTEVSYTSFGLPEEVREYDANATTVLRRAHTEYVAASVNAAGAYTARRIIGLPEKREVYGLDGGAEKLFSKMTYEYDLGGEFLSAPELSPAEVTQHDEANFGAGFAWRGVLCRTRRWDVTDQYNPSESVATEAGYNTLGSVVFVRDPRLRRTNISYTDSDQGKRLAYPTTVTNPAGFTASTWYNYDMGAVVKTETPKPNVTTDQAGPQVERFYDAVGRPLKVRRVTDGAQTSLDYGANGLYVKQITLSDTDQPETFVMSVVDGAGRTRGTLREMPGGYSALRFGYDKLGRQVRQYNPILVSAQASDLSNVAGWEPAGEDATAGGGTGWVYASTAYDWKGRPVLVTAAGSPAATTEFDYGGCGCAGGEVTLSRDEVGRRQKVTTDVLGRVVEAQDLDILDKGLPLTDAGTVYRTMLSTYNALDQVTETRTFAGASESDPTKIVKGTTVYDGHGRPRWSHAPGQAAGRDTGYLYYPDDAVKTVTDARGVVVTYGYNSRRLLESVDYDLSGVLAGQVVEESADVDYAYDAAGNRKTMSMHTAAGSQGGVAYVYDEFSRLAEEARQFPGLSGAYTLSYGYTLSGQLKSVTDKTNPSSPVGFSYKFDAVGRVTEVASTGMGASEPLASGAQYRAWGGLKGVSYGDTTNVAMTYDARGLVKGYTLSGAKDNVTGAARSEGGDFQYYADGLVKYATDYLTRSLHTGVLDRAYSYDLTGRLKEAYSGEEARAFVGDNTPGSADVPYRQTYIYDVWDNQRDRTGHYWGQDDSAPVGFDPAAGRTPGWDYDADGRLVSRNEEPPNGLQYEPMRFKYDAAGRQAQTSQTTSRQLSTPAHPVWTTAVTMTDSYDGDGLGVRRVKVTKLNANPPGTSTIYYLRSSVLGGRLVAEYGAAGARKTSYAYAGGEVLAVVQDADTSTPRLRWQHMNPVTGDARETDATGRVRAETYLDPGGANVGLSNPFASAESGELGSSGEGMSQASIDARVAQLLPGYGGQQCSVDGMATSCALASSLVESGAASQCPNNECSRFQTVNGVTFYQTYRAYADGVEGYLGVGIDYVGDGFIFNSVWTGGKPEKNELTGNVYESLIASFNGAGGDRRKGKRRPKRDSRMSAPSSQKPTTAPTPAPPPPSPPDPKSLLDPGVFSDGLGECLKRELQPYFNKINLGDVKVHHYIPLLPKFWAHPDAYTVRYDVYFKNFLVGGGPNGAPLDEDGYTTMIHEFVHVEQMSGTNLPLFLKTYAESYLGNRERGMSDHDAYEAVIWEEAARKRAAQIIQDYKNNHNGKLPCKP
jgi:YD repeat-containing protein